MKKVVIVLVVLLVISSLAWSQDADRPPRGAVSLVIGGFILAPIGVSGELFLGNFGIEAELRGLFFGFGNPEPPPENYFFGTVEPGLNFKFYFSELDSSLYLTAGASYGTFWVSEEGVANGGIFQPKVALGYHALFGKNNRTRFGIELGGVWWQWVDQNDLLEFGNLLLPYGKLYFGRVF